MYMFFWFFKQLFYILKRLVKHKLLLLFVFFVIALFLFIKPSFCASDTYGNYHGFSAEQINTINNLIQEDINLDEGAFDSFFCRFYRTNDLSQNLITIFFYNQSTNGRLYKTDVNYGAYPYQCFNIFSESSSTNSVKYYSYDLNNNFAFINSGYRDVINTVTTCNNDQNRSNFYLYTNRNLYTNNSYNTIFYNGGDFDLFAPFITNSSSEIINFSFTNLIINARCFTFF